MTPQKPSAKTFLIGGLLPILAFTLVEQYYGVVGGLIAGILFGLGEMVWEYKRDGRIQRITIGANLLVVLLGVVSLFEGDGFWFKLQPAILLFIFGAILLVSSLMKKPFLVAMAKKQNPELPEAAEHALRGMNFRISFVFFALTALSVHAALAWSTAAWATLKGVGVPAILVVYMLLEALAIRLRIKRR